jgi:hypothetical protein
MAVLIRVRDGLLHLAEREHARDNDADSAADGKDRLEPGRGGSQPGEHQPQPARWAAVCRAGPPRAGARRLPALAAGQGPGPGKRGARGSAAGLQPESRPPEPAIQGPTEQHERTSMACAHPAADLLKAVSRWLNRLRRRAQCAPEDVVVVAFLCSHYFPPGPLVALVALLMSLAPGRPAVPRWHGPCDS